MSIKLLRVLQITLTLEIGGLETLVIELSKQLIKRGIEIEVVCLSNVDTDYVTGLKEYKIPIHVFKKKYRWDFGFFLQVARFIREKQFDIVHAHSGCFLCGALFSRLAGVKKYIYTAHGMPIQTGLKARTEDIFASLMTDCVVSVSFELEVFLKKWLIFNCCSFETIINGVDTNKFKRITDFSEKRRLLKKYELPVDQFLVGSVGRLEPVKNYGMLLQAFAKLMAEFGNNIHLLLIGEGVQKKELIRLAEELKVSQNVHFLGMQYNVHELLPLLDVFVLSSLTEGTSISLLESQACGVPAVVTDVGGNGFVVSSGENGYLCPLNDHEAMAENILKIIRDDDCSSLLKKNARKKAESLFSVYSMVEKYEKLYYCNLN